MKKKLELELMSIAHRILKLSGREDIDALHHEAGLLYEKLSVLKFVNENMVEPTPTIGTDSSFFDMLNVAFNNEVSDHIEHDNKVYVDLDEVEDDAIMEPVMEKIKDIVAQMPQETHAVDALFDAPTPEIPKPKDDFEILTEGFKDLPVFEPAPTSKPHDPHKKSLNDKLKHGLHIGLNDKIAFIKYLFDGEHEDYERVLSQINTSSTYDEAEYLIQNIVKPDYNGWLGKEDVEARFMSIIEGKFE